MFEIQKHGRTSSNTLVRQGDSNISKMAARKPEVDMKSNNIYISYMRDSNEIPTALAYMPMFQC